MSPKQLNMATKQIYNTKQGHELLGLSHTKHHLLIPKEKARGHRNIEKYYMHFGHMSAAYWSEVKKKKLFQVAHDYLQCKIVFVH